MDSMTDDTILIAGQRIKVAPLTDYQVMFMIKLFDGASLVIDRQIHSDFLCMIVEVIAPTIPKKLYKKTASGYWWMGNAAEFGDLIGGLESLCRQQFPQYLEQENVEPIAEAPQTLEALQAEIAALRSALAPAV